MLPPEKDELPIDMAVDIYATHNLGIYAEISLFTAICANIPDDYKNRESIEAAIAGWKEWRRKGGRRENFQR